MAGLDDDETTPPEGERRTGNANPGRRSQSRGTGSLDEDGGPPTREEQRARKPAAKKDVAGTAAPSPAPAPAGKSKAPAPAPPPARSSSSSSSTSSSDKMLAGAKSLPGGMKLMRASEIEDRHLKILIFGANGSGKTDAAVRGFAEDLGEVLVMALEPQGLDTILSANPKAIVPGIERDADGKWAGGLRDMDQVRDFIEYVMEGHLDELGVTTIVFDGLTEALNMIADEILAGKPKEKRKRLSQDDYGVVKARARGLLKTLRDLPYHVICTALLDDEKDDETGTRLSKPMLIGSIRNEVGAYFHSVIYLYRQAQNPGVPARRYAMVDGGDRYSVKGHGGLKGIIRVPASDWLRQMLGMELEEPLTIEDAMPPDEYRRSTSNKGSDTESVKTADGSGGGLD